MTTILTEIGWEDENGNSLGTWTNQADLVDEGDEITVAEGVTANSLAGGDTIISSRQEFFAGINNSGTINTGVGRDVIDGFGDPFGILNSGTINTGIGGDVIDGSSDTIGIRNESNGIINTGAGRDVIDAGGDIGFENSGTIDMGPGRDSIDAGGLFGGIKNSGTIDMGPGRDSIAGESPGAAGIDNTGTIDTGAGKDTVDALTGTGGVGRFGGGGSIDLGVGRDLIRGFGEQIVDGGRGFDTAELGIDFDENQITLGSTAPTSIDITFDSATMSFTDVELFDFNGQEFALEQLQDIV
ncbi:MAG: hypothetical protein QNJ72_39115 [Pleurocapsa sp. MO_226.B13]|nr:hypothetical protein [Pleurocapsa sp. MO_226.B13]